MLFASFNETCLFSLLLRRVPRLFLVDALLQTLTEVSGQETEDIAETNVAGGRRELRPISLTLVVLWLFGFCLVKDLQLSCASSEVQVCIVHNVFYPHALTPRLSHIPKKSIHSPVKGLSKERTYRVHSRIKVDYHKSNCNNETNYT